MAQGLQASLRTKAKVKMKVILCHPHLSCIHFCQTATYYACTSQLCCAVFRSRRDTVLVAMTIYTQSMRHSGTSCQQRRGMRYNTRITQGTHHGHYNDHDLLHAIKIGRADEDIWTYLVGRESSRIKCGHDNKRAHTIA